MAYMFDLFKNIRTFPGETRVYADEIFMPDLSAGGGGHILPLHVIHVGRINGNAEWILNMDEARQYFLTARIEAADARLNLCITASAAGASFDGLIFCKNTGDFTFSLSGVHNAANTGIACRAKIFAMTGSRSDLAAVCDIPCGIKGAKNDIGISVLADRDVKSIRMSPAQRISSVPEASGHSASIWRPGEAAIQFLETAGLSRIDADALMNRVFLETV